MKFRAHFFAVALAVAVPVLSFLAVIAASGPAAPGGAPASPCPGFPEKALLVTYDENLSDILDVNGTKKAVMLRWNFTCTGVRPATQYERGPPRPGWSSVVYEGLAFGVPKRFGAVFPDNVSWFDSTPYAVFVTNGSRCADCFRGPLAWLGGMEGADPRWLVAASLEGNKR